MLVLGAGAAGLMAARELQRADCDVVVLEASGRVGGRIRTLYDTAAGIPLELGAEFIQGEAPETSRLLAEAHLVTVPVLGERYRSHRDRLSLHGLERHGSRPIERSALHPPRYPGGSIPQLRYATRARSSKRGSSRSDCHTAR